jgi:hypothetical protein
VQFEEEGADSQRHLQRLAAQLDEERTEFDSYRNNAQVVYQQGTLVSSLTFKLFKTVLLH